MANKLAIPEMSSSQIEKYATFNMAIKYLSALQAGVIDRITAYPGSPVENGLYLVSAAFGAHELHDLLFYLGSAWYEMDPVDGMRVHVIDEDRDYLFDGSAWVVTPEYKGERLLATVTAGMQTADGAQTLYTVPTGKKFVPTRVVVRNPTASLADGTDFDFGDGANRDTWKNAVDLSGMTATTDCMVITYNDTKFTVFDAADTFGFKPVTGSTADANATFDVFGYIYDA